jgi:threonine synthase
MYRLVGVHCNVGYTPNANIYNSEEGWHTLTVKYDLDENITSHDVYLSNSINQYQLGEDQKIFDCVTVKHLNCTAPNKIIHPIINIGNISAMYKNTHKLRDVGYIDRLLMRMIIQTEYVRSVADAIKNYMQEVMVEQNSETITSVIHEIKRNAKIVTDNESITMWHDHIHYDIGVESISIHRLPIFTNLLSNMCRIQGENCLFVTECHSKIPKTVIK